MFITDSFAAAYGNTLATLLVIAWFLLSVFVRAVAYHLKKLEIDMPTHVYDIFLAPIVYAFVMYVILTGSKAVALEMYCCVFVVQVIGLGATFIALVNGMRKEYELRDAKAGIKKFFGSGE
jgi:hypothetical protein